MPRLAVLGPLWREYLLPYEGRAVLDVPGGPALYAAVGAALWEPDLGLVARLAPDFPKAWLARLRAAGWDTRGLRYVDQPVEGRRVFAYPRRGRGDALALAPLFRQRGLHLPPDLLDYAPPPNGLDSRRQPGPLTLRASDLPPWLVEARAAVFAPHDFLTHLLVPAEVRRRGPQHIILDPAPGYMHPAFREDLRGVLLDASAFLPAEDEARELFAGLTDDLWAMAEELALWGADIVVIKRGAEGAAVYDAASRRRWWIPAYPARVHDPTGVGAAFAGGFAAGFLRHYDPLEAALYGGVSASFVIETSGALAARDPLDGLPQARLERLRAAVRPA